MNVQPASTLDRYVTADFTADTPPAATGGEGATLAVEQNPEQESAEDAPASHETALPPMYARNARAVPARAAHASISLIA